MHDVLIYFRVISHSVLSPLEKDTTPEKNDIRMVLGHPTLHVHLFWFYVYLQCFFLTFDVFFLGLF